MAKQKPQARYVGVGASPQRVARSQELRRSGAAGLHASRADRRARDRSAARRRAVRRDIAAG